MGNHASKDKNIDIYLETTKEIYTAGEYLSGYIHINCHESSLYNLLELRLSCLERGDFKELIREKRKVSRMNSENLSEENNSYCSYEQRLKINEFKENIIVKGQYTFPFTLLLPSGFPGTFNENNKNYLRYQLLAELKPVNQVNVKLYPQYKEIYLNILEPARLPFGHSSTASTIIPKCCSCLGCCSCCNIKCCSYGEIIVSLASDKNFFTDEDEINLHIELDNTKGTNTLTHVVVTFNQNKASISSKRKLIVETQKTFKIYEHKNPIEPGKREAFSFKAKIPSYFSDESTAIGTIVAKYFTLKAQASVGCCSDEVKNELHVVYHSFKPKVEKFDKIPPPENWGPYKFETKAFNNIKPFNYIPEPNIPFLNRPDSKGQNSQANLESMLKMVSNLAGVKGSPQLTQEAENQYFGLGSEKRLNGNKKL